MVAKPNKPKLDGMMQTVYITLSDGTIAPFSGRSIANEGDQRTISGIQFGRPQKLPDGCYFEAMKANNETE